jgi:hypothetical protein
MNNGHETLKNYLGLGESGCGIFKVPHFIWDNELWENISELVTSHNLLIQQKPVNVFAGVVTD